jgi:hypothetical protein
MVQEEMWKKANGAHTKKLSCCLPAENEENMKKL